MAMRLRFCTGWVVLLAGKMLTKDDWTVNYGPVQTSRAERPSHQMREFVLAVARVRVTSDTAPFFW